MKYLLILLFLTVSSIERITGDDIAKEEFNHLRNQVEKIVEPVLKEGHQLIEKLQKMKMQVIKKDTNTTQCKEFEGTLKRVEAIDQNITLTVQKTSLKIKQDILNLQKECSKPNTTIFDVLKCIQDHPTILKDIQDIPSTIASYMKQISSFSMTVNEQLQQCLKSQVTNAPVKPKA